MKLLVFVSIVCMYSVDLLASCCCPWWGSSAVVPLGPVAAATCDGACTPYEGAPNDILGAGAREMAARRTVPAAAAATATGSSQDMAGAAADVARDCIGLDSSRPTPRLPKEAQKRMYLREREHPTFLWSSLPEKEANKGLTLAQAKELKEEVSKFMKDVMGDESGFTKKLKGLMSGDVPDPSQYERQVHWFWSGINHRIKAHCKDAIEAHKTKVFARCIVLLLESDRS